MKFPKESTKEEKYKQNQFKDKRENGKNKFEWQKKIKAKTVNLDREEFSLNNIPCILSENSEKQATPTKGNYIKEAEGDVIIQIVNE